MCGEAMSQRKEERRGGVQFCTYHSSSHFHKIPSAAVIYHDNMNQHQTCSHVDRELQRYPEAPIYCIQLSDSFLFITFPLYVLPPKVLQPHPLHSISKALIWIHCYCRRRLLLSPNLDIPRVHERALLKLNSIPMGKIRIKRGRYIPDVL